MNTSFPTIVMRIFSFILILSVLAAYPGRAPGGVSAAATIIPVFHVTNSVGPGGDGASWATAFNDLQDAITAVQVSATCQVNPCQIWVAGGPYMLEDGHSFNLNGGSEFIYGGFIGNEIDLSARNWRAHPTTLVGKNSNVIYAYGFTGALDGFTIMGGAPTGQVNGRGGGISIKCGAPLLFNLNITGNSASHYGGGVYMDFFGCPPQASNPSLMNTIITNNSALYGGGVAFLGKFPTLIDVVLSGNTATQGDGIYNYISSPTLTNTTMSNDGIYNYQSSPTIQNSILWGLNSAITNEDSNGVTTITYSLVKGCKPGATWNDACGTDGGHNLADIDPKFVGELPLDLHLQAASPAIDQGSNALIPGYVTATDLDGNPRVANSVVDLGAYEFQSANVPPVVTNFTKTGLKNQDIPFALPDFTSHYSDADGDALNSVRIIVLPAQGSLDLAGNPVTLNQVIPAGSLSSLHFSPSSDWGGTVMFGWTASDGKAFSPNTATVTILVFSFQTFIPDVRK